MLCTALPSPILGNFACVCNNKIYAICREGMYQYDGNNWENVFSKSISTTIYHYSVVAYNNEIYMLDNGNFSKFDGSSWTSLPKLPFSPWSFNRMGSLVVYNGEIHLIGTQFQSDAGSTAQSIGHYKWDGNTWTYVGGTPNYFPDTSVVVYNDEIHVLGNAYDHTNSDNGGSFKAHYKWDGNTWTRLANMPLAHTNGVAIVYSGKLYTIGDVEGSNYDTYHEPHRFYVWDEINDTWSSLKGLSFACDHASAVVYNDNIHILKDSLHFIPNINNYAIEVRQ